MSLLGEVICGNKAAEVGFQLIVEMESLNGGSLDGSVHALDLPVGPGMVGLVESMLDPVTKTGAFDGMTAPASAWTLAVLARSATRKPLSVRTAWTRLGTAATSA